MLSGQGNKNSERTTMGLISKKETLHAQQTLHARQQRETSRIFLVKRFMEEMSSMFLFTFHWYFSFSHCHYKIFMLFFQQKMSLLFFISCSI